jgi:hypothetical protein
MSEASSPPQPPATPTGCLLVDQSGRPAITVTRYTGDPAAALQPMALGDTARQTILALLRAAPGMVLAANAGGGAAYTLRFAPHVAAQLAGGQASLMSAIDGGVRTIAVNGQGRIVAHGTLVPLTGISPALAALGIWQALAVITAQQYLVDIQRQLRQITGAVAALRQWHEDREIGQIESSYDYLERTKDLLLSGPVFDVERGAIIGQLEQIEREAGGVIAARRQSLARTIEQTSTQPLGGTAWWSVEHNVNQMIQHVRSAAADLQVIEMGLGLQATAAYTQGALLGRSRKSADLLRAASAGAKEAREQWRTLATTIYGRIREITSVSDVRRVSRNLQALVALEVDAATALVVPKLSSLESAANSTQARELAESPEQAPPLQIIVQTLPDGTIAAFHQQTADTLPDLPTAPDLSALIAIRKLQGTSGLTLARWEDLRQASEQFQLRDGTSVHSFTNVAGFRHIFLVAPSGVCLFGGFVPPTHATALKKAITEIRNLLGV